MADFAFPFYESVYWALIFVAYVIWPVINNYCCARRISIEARKCAQYEVKQENEFEQDSNIEFDPQYNINGIDWNELYVIICDEAKSMKVQRIINEKLDLTNIEKYNFPSNILKFIALVQKQVDRAMAVHNACNDDSGWILQTDSDNICIKYKKEEGTPLHAIRSDFICQCNVVDFIAVLNEFDLFGELMKFMKIETEMIAEFTNSDKVVYMHVNMWWPLKNRDYVLHVGACDASAEMDEVIVWANSPKNDQISGHPQVHIKSEAECKTVRVDITRLEICCKPIQFGIKNEKDISRFVMISVIDFKSFVPLKIINWFTRTFQYSLVKFLRARCENLQGTKHETRIKTKAIYRKWTATMFEWQKKKLSQKNKTKSCNKVSFEEQLEMIDAAVLFPHIGCTYFESENYLKLIPMNDPLWIESELLDIDDVKEYDCTHLDAFEPPEFGADIPYLNTIIDALDLFKKWRNMQWKPLRQKNVNAYYMSIANEAISAVKSEMSLPYSVPIICGIVMNDAHLPQYNVTYKGGTIKQIQNLTTFASIVYLYLVAPIPFISARDMLVVRFIYILPHCEVIFCEKSMAKPVHPKDTALNNKKIVRGDVTLNLWHIRPDYNSSDKHKNSLVTVYSHGRANGSLPGWLIDQKVGDQAQTLYKMKKYIQSIQNTLHKPGVLHIPFPLLQSMKIFNNATNEKI